MVIGKIKPCKFSLKGRDRDTSPIAEILETSKHILYLGKATEVIGGQGDGKVIRKCVGQVYNQRTALRMQCPRVRRGMGNSMVNVGLESASNPVGAG